MSTKKSINRRQAIGGTVALLAGAAIVPLPAFAKDAVDAFYETGEFTYCDLKMLAKFWGSDTYEAKLDAGNMLLSGEHKELKEKITIASRQWSASGNRCNFEDADNPSYSYDDAVKLAAYWGGGMTPFDAKLKVASNLETGDNLWVKSELQKAR